MIRKYERDIGQNYYNIFERIFIGLINEYYEILAQFNVYDFETQKYNRRIVGWFFFFLALLVVLFSPIYIAAFVYVIKAFI